MNTGDGGKLGISGYGTTLSRIFDENMNRMTYCEVLRHELVQSMSMMSNKSELIFQQDLASWHTSNIVQATIKQMKLKVLHCVPKRPDLNPVEMPWSILDKNLAFKTTYSSGMEQYR